MLFINKQIDQKSSRQMAKNSLSVLDQERRKQKAKELKKRKEERSKEKLERLKQIDPKRLLKRINELKEKKQRNNGRLLYNEEKTLTNLQKDLEYIERKKHVEPTPNEDNKEDDEKEEKVVRLGKKSIFYDAEWNPLGEAPKGFINVEYPLSDPTMYQADEDLSDVPLPNSPKPRFFKHELVKTTYEHNETPKTEQLNFIPSSILRKR